ncbi:MAG: YggS family pyridoxal phosphate-dependent enzyme [Candidatus Heimdallarchaeota archaeon]|nr:YggS family pyridoxal phosphate-dependent enzyme [Candidatus Heimdallarchaeota archaeon]
MEHEQLVRVISDNYSSLVSMIESFVDEQSLSMPTIIAVSKTKSLSHIYAAIDIGIRDFGENYAKELADKAAKVPNVNWHYIGPLQSGNIRYLTYANPIIHTLSKSSHIDKLIKRGITKPVFIQVNISEESSKAGVSYKQLPNIIDDVNQSNLDLIGLMGIGNASWDMATCESEYKKLVNIGKEHSLHEYSIGMTGDWQAALLAGSTMLRIGTAIFGIRN